MVLWSIEVWSPPTKIFLDFSWLSRCSEACSERNSRTSIIFSLSRCTWVRIDRHRGSLNKTMANFFGFPRVKAIYSGYGSEQFSPSRFPRTSKSKRCTYLVRILLPSLNSLVTPPTNISLISSLFRFWKAWASFLDPPALFRFAVLFSTFILVWSNLVYLKLQIIRT